MRLKSSKTMRVKMVTTIKKARPQTASQLAYGLKHVKHGRKRAMRSFGLV